MPDLPDFARIVEQYIALAITCAWENRPREADWDLRQACFFFLEYERA